MTETKENTATDFEVFKTVKIGTHDSVEELISRIKKGNREISDKAEDLMGFLNSSEFKLSPETKEVKLVKTSTSDLGITDITQYNQIIDQAKELGLSHCPIEAGLQFCLDYSNQPHDERVIIIHKAIPLSAILPSIFALDNECINYFLPGCGCCLDDLLFPEYKILFAR